MAKPPPKKQGKDRPAEVRIVNRKARHDYHIVEVVECGLELMGSEVKSIRARQVKIDEAYARVRGGEAFLVGVEIALYPHAVPAMQHEAKRDRRLLLHRRQISQLESHAKVKGNTLVPLAVYFKNGWAKCELGLAMGKRQFDKRDEIKKREMQRDISREMSRRRKS